MFNLTCPPAVYCVWSAVCQTVECAIDAISTKLCSGAAMLLMSTPKDEYSKECHICNGLSQLLMHLRNVAASAHVALHLCYDSALWSQIAEQAGATASHYEAQAEQIAAVATAPGRPTLMHSLMTTEMRLHCCAPQHHCCPASVHGQSTLASELWCHKGCQGNPSCQAACTALRLFQIWQC
eukprot:372692-Pelagomonas_calceolata.AAC.5